jgi:predicted nucleic acid-binding protein
MMPVYTIPAHQHDIPRNAVILDTNVLVAAFYPRDQYHEPARTFIDECSDPFVVPIAVLIETWGWIVGSRKYWEGGIDLLLWLNTPGSAELLPQDTARFDEAGNVIRSLYVDCVDALVSQLADDISRHCQFDPHIKIATYDTADIWKCKMTNALQLTVLDLKSWHLEY